MRKDMSFQDLWNSSIPSWLDIRRCNHHEEHEEEEEK